MVCIASSSPYCSVYILLQQKAYWFANQCQNIGVKQNLLKKLNELGEVDKYKTWLVANGILNKGQVSLKHLLQ